MLKSNSIFIFVIIQLGLSCVSLTPLDDYVNKYDPNYQYKITNWVYKGDGYTMYCINMTSQKWLTENDTSNPIWYHAINIAVPDIIKNKNTAFVYIGPGDNDPNYVPDMSSSDDFNWFISLMAVSSGTISAIIRNIPNQPTVFKSDPSKMKRDEDAFMAWTWFEFLSSKSGQPEWLSLLPMTKAAVRGLDTIASFGLKYGTNIIKFVAIGESKRGWATWLTAAVDKRVIAIVPIVFDLLNFKNNILHHYRSLGGWTFAFKDYYNANVTSYFDEPVAQDMANIIDPYVYRDRTASIPKHIITTSSDEMMIPDDSYYYFNDIQGEKLLRILPNAEHLIKFHRVSMFLGIRAFYLSVLTNYTRPQIRCERFLTPNGGLIKFYTDVQPIEINAYYADTLDGKRRDFRIAQQDPNGEPGTPAPHPIVYHKDTVQNPSPGLYIATYNNPSVGWRNFFISATFQGPEDSTFEFTSENQIIPDVLPYPVCQGAQCLGKLV